MSNQPASEGRLAYKWKVLISVIFGIFMIILDTTVVNVAFQTLRREYGASLNEAQWIISIYVLALGITTPVSGFLADRFGLKRIYIWGLGIFTIGSFLCGLAPSLWALVAARALQGIGGGMAQPLGPALLYRTFPPKEQGVALGYFGIALVVAPAMGPILGGFLVDIDLWRWIFFINVPIGIVGIVLASRFLRTEPIECKPRLDPLGLITSVIGFGSLLYAATHVAESGWTSSSVIVWFVVGTVALITFAIIELFVAKEPLLDLRLFANRNFLTAGLIGYVTVLALFGAEFLMPLYLQSLRGLSALDTGIVLLPLAVAAGITTPIAGRLYDKIGPRPLVVTGFGLLIINTWQLAQLQADTPIWWIAVLLALRGVALGMTVQTTFATALASVPRPLLPRGSSLINSTRFVVQSIGVAILATVLASAISPEVRAQQQQLQATPASESPAQPFGLCETPDDLTPELRAGMQQACNENVIGFERTYLLTFYFAIAALVIAFFMPGWPLGWQGRGSLEQPSPAH
ncbi:MAG: hypothetical protein GFH27_549287n97 [Chloroflexi bacterium AL-W]|nr:hypothetical protein [Chloroflexi bacterium AL-N1]NOK66371.1 hypothetical protein [Chloroflexi bacterium AL-N10]NOK71759.1 hypothetical protein [Chloroflexi bacterium AL-N5]NOK81016.1 hypothetical protein [Chloroflexi bacterium AL-W]NOK89289.1 hypothetical protein [Chloroflexi bacterium AL-N15]